MSTACTAAAPAAPSGPSSLSTVGTGAPAEDFDNIEMEDDLEDCEDDLDDLTLDDSPDFDDAYVIEPLDAPDSATSNTRGAPAAELDSESSSYIFASGVGTPSTASDFDHVSRMSLEPPSNRSAQPRSRSAERSGTDSVDQATTQLSYLELYDRLRAEAIARGEAAARRRIMSSSCSETTEETNPAHTSTTSSGYATPAFPDFTPLFAPDGTYLGRASDTLASESGPGSTTPKTNADIPPEVLEELSLFRHAWLEEVGAIPEEQLVINQEWFLDDEDAAHIEMLLENGFSVEDIQRTQATRYLELQRQGRSAAADKGKSSVANAQRTPGYDAPGHFSNLYEMERIRKQMDARLRPMPSSGNMATGFDTRDWDASDAATAPSQLAAPANGARPAPPSVIINLDRGFWPYGATSMLNPPDADYRLLWHSRTSIFSAQRFVEAILPSLTPDEPIYAQAPDAPPPLVRSGDLLPHLQGHLERRRSFIARDVGDIVRIQGSLSSSEAASIPRLVASVFDDISDLAKQIRCTSGRFTFRATTETVDSTWRTLVLSLCEWDGALCQKSKLHTLKVEASEILKALELEHEREYTISAYLSDVFNKTDIDEHRRLFSEHLQLRPDTLVPDVYELLGVRPGKKFSCEDGLELPDFGGQSSAPAIAT